MRSYKSGFIKTPTLIVVMLAFILSACVNNGQNNYSYQDVGKPTVVEFGKVVAVRTVDITGQNTGLGAGAGAIGGAALARSGDAKGALLGLLIGAVAGGITEQAIANRHGTEYTIALRNRKIITVVQEIHESDPIFAPGTRVIVQTSGQYQRVLSAQALPTKITRAKGIKQVDDDSDDDAPAKPVHKKVVKKQPPPEPDDSQDSSGQ